MNGSGWLCEEASDGDGNGDKGCKYPCGIRSGEAWASVVKQNEKPKKCEDELGRGGKVVVVGVCVESFLVEF